MQPKWGVDDLLKPKSPPWHWNWNIRRKKLPASFVVCLLHGCLFYMQIANGGSIAFHEWLSLAKCRCTWKSYRAVAFLCMGWKYGVCFDSWNVSKGTCSGCMLQILVTRAQVCVWTLVSWIVIVMWKGDEWDKLTGISPYSAALQSSKVLLSSPVPVTAGSCFEQKSCDKVTLHYLPSTKQHTDTGSDVLVKIVEHLAAKYSIIFPEVEWACLEAEIQETWASKTKIIDITMDENMCFCYLVRLTLWK